MCSSSIAQIPNYRCIVLLEAQHIRMNANFDIYCIQSSNPIISSILMQSEKECANYIFSRVGQAYDPLQPYQSEVIFSQMLLGSLFIRGYRIIAKQDQYKCCIFYKRSNFQTEYLYLKFLTAPNPRVSQQDINDISSSVKVIDDMKSSQQLVLKVVLAFLAPKSFVELDKYQWTTYTSDATAKLQVTEWSRSIEKEEQKMMVTSKDELTKLKDIVWTYINTFGSKYKNNYYCDLQKRNPTPFNIEKLINTVNWIIYCETVDKPYNQIETANWTCFQKRAKEKLKPDRKDILLTGSGRSMMIHLLLLEKIDNYKKEYENEVGEVIFQFRKSYLQGEVKAYEIGDELDSYNLIYKLRGVSIQRFNTI